MKRARIVSLKQLSIMIPSHDIMVCVVVLISYIVVRYGTYVSIIILIQQNFIICGPQVTFVIVIEQWWYIISAIMDNINAMSHYHCLSLIIQWFQAILMNQTIILFFNIFFFFTKDQKALYNVRVWEL